MSDYEAFRYAPMSYLLCALISFGITLTFGAPWKFGLGLTLFAGTLVWCATVAREIKEREKTAGKQPPVESER